MTVDAGRVAFRHDLVRSGGLGRGVARDAPRGAPRAGAAVPADDVDRRAWHLGEATTAPDAAGRRCARRGRRPRRRAWRARRRRRGLRAGRAAHAGPRRPRASASSRPPSSPGAPASPTPRSTCSPRGGDCRRRPACASRAARARRGGRGTHRLGRARAGRARRRGPTGSRRGPRRGDPLLADGVLAAQFAGDIATAAPTAAARSRCSSRAPRGPAWLGTMATGSPASSPGSGGPRPAPRRHGAGATQLLADPQLAPWLVVGPLYLRESAVGRDVIPTVVGAPAPPRRPRRSADPAVLRRPRPGDDRPLGRRRRRLHRGRSSWPARPGRPPTSPPAWPGWPGSRPGAATRRVPRAREEALGLARAHHLGFFQAWALHGARRPRARPRPGRGGARRVPRRWTTC